MKSETLSEKVPRRNRSRQRERLLDVLRSTETHPSASWLFEELRAEFPRLSLGTVYRNLDVLIEDGEIEPVPETGGLRRFCGTTQTHHHFQCDECGGIMDIEFSLSRKLKAQVEGDYGIMLRKARIHCEGLCPDCSA